METYDLIVIGGGLIGSAIAWGTARAGLNVALLDEGDTAFRAARGNFGLVWLQGKGVGLPPYMHWSIGAGQAWPELATILQDTTGLDVGFRQPGGLHFCFSEAELAARQAVKDRTQRDGGAIELELLDRAATRQRVPGLGDEVVGALFCASDACVNPLLLLRAFQQGLRSAGGSYHPGCPVSVIEPGRSGFVVFSGARRFLCRKLVIAAGLGATPLAAAVGLEIPLRPERGQIIVTERMKPFFGYVSGSVRQTVEGSVLIGSSHEEAGFDDGTDVPTMTTLARTAVRAFPQLKAANVVRVWGSLRVMTPDRLPVYEQSSLYPGAFAVTCHSGVTLASQHALHLAPAIAAGALPEAVRAFTSERFHVQAA